MKSFNQKFSEEKAKLIKMRRQLLKEKKMEKYEEVVNDMIQKEECRGTDLLKKAMVHIGLNE